jgi:glycine/D-amino acid oxidase-like deaminating enzyme
MSDLMRPPNQDTYDVVIIGGAIMGCATAWFLTKNPDFDGRILVVERDPTFSQASTTHTNSCIRQQYSTALNVKISQFGADFINNIRTYMGGDERVPQLSIRNFGYMYLANTPTFADTLRTNHKVQVGQGAATELLTTDQIKARYPFYNVDDILLGSINTVNEGYWDGGAVFDWWRRQSRENGAEHIHNEVVAINCNAADDRVESITLRTGQVISCGQLVNASGPHAAVTAKMAGIDLPVEPRKRFSWIFRAEQPIEQDLPLTIDPSGVHVRENGGGTYLAGGHTDVDPAADFTDFTMDHEIWEDFIWPNLANRIPQFEAIKVQSEWAGHYAYNTLDQNAIIGPHTVVKNFFFQNGFSGHGLQQSPAMGRGMSELLTYGEFRTLDMSSLGYERVATDTAYIETAVI